MRTATKLLEDLALRGDDPGALATIEEMRRCWENFVESGLFVEVEVVRAGVDVDLVKKLISRCPNIRIGWSPDGDDTVLSSPLPCWLESPRGYIEVGVVVAADEPELRKRIVEYAKPERFYMNGGLGSKSYPVMKSADGHSFIVQLL